MQSLPLWQKGVLFASVVAVVVALTARREDVFDRFGGRSSVLEREKRAREALWVTREVNNAPPAPVVDLRKAVNNADPTTLAIERVSEPSASTTAQEAAAPPFAESLSLSPSPSSAPPAAPQPRKWLSGFFRRSREGLRASSFKEISGGDPAPHKTMALYAFKLLEACAPPGEFPEANTIVLPEVKLEPLPTKEETAVKADAARPSANNSTATTTETTVASGVAVNDTAATAVDSSEPPSPELLQALTNMGIDSPIFEAPIEGIVNTTAAASQQQNKTSAAANATSADTSSSSPAEGEAEEEEMEPLPPVMEEKLLLLRALQRELNLTDADAAESYAEAVSVQLARLVENAVDALKIEGNTTLAAMDALTAYMDSAAHLFMHFASNVNITPVVYSGRAPRNRLESLYLRYTLACLDGNDEDRDDTKVDQLRVIFGISERKAQQLSEQAWRSRMQAQMPGAGDLMKLMSGEGGGDFNKLMQQLQEGGGLEGLGDDDAESLEALAKLTKGTVPASGALPCLALPCGAVHRRTTTTQYNT